MEHAGLHHLSMQSDTLIHFHLRRFRRDSRVTDRLVFGRSPSEVYWKQLAYYFIIEGEVAISFQSFQPQPCITPTVNIYPSTAHQSEVLPLTDDNLVARQFVVRSMTKKFQDHGFTCARISFHQVMACTSSFLTQVTSCRTHAILGSTCSQSRHD